MKDGKPLFIRRIELKFIQGLLAKRGEKMDWMIIKSIDNETGMSFNLNKMETSKKEEVVFIRQREIDHILHHLYLAHTEYATKIMHQIVEQTGIPFHVSSSCFTDYSFVGKRG